MVELMESEVYERDAIRGKACPKISTFEYALAFSLPLIVGFEGLLILGAFHVWSITLAAISAFVLVKMIQLKRKNMYVIQIDKDGYNKLISGEKSTLFRLASNRYFEINKPLERSYKDDRRNILSRYTLEFSVLIVRLGGVRFDHLPDEIAHESLHGEWEYSLEQSESTEERFVKSLYLIPDSISTVFKFGYIGRLVSKVKSVFGAREEDCFCGQNDCKCGKCNR